MKTLLWLDDIRNPRDTKVDWLQYSPIGYDVNVVWVKSYAQFIKYITEFGLPDGICFDHDLGKITEIELRQQGYSKEAARKAKQEEKSGYDCVNWLIEYCMDHECDVPPVGFQTSNPVGKENMMMKINNFRKVMGYV